MRIQLTSLFTSVLRQTSKSQREIHNLCKINRNLIVITRLHSTNQSSRSKSHKMNQNIDDKAENFFNLANYDCIGFDLDNTIVRYNVKNMIYHEYQVLSEFLINRGYSKEFLSKPIEEDADFMQKGLVLDFERGNLLRICPDGTIQKASHGTKFMSKAEVIAIYGETQRWEVTDEYCKDMLVAWNGTLADLIRTCLDYFDMPAALAFARIVDSIDLSKGGQRQEKYTVWPDILDGLMFMYSRERFDSNESPYFVGLKNNPAKFVNKCDPSVLSWLKELRKKKKIFLVTGSHVDFASLTASHALGANWRDFFDIVICFSKKPGFFTMNRPFLQLDGIKETSPIDWKDLQTGQVYTQGNFKDLVKFMSKLTGKDDVKTVYVGDNLIQDVFTPNKHIGIDTIAIVEEMLAEGVNYDETFEILRSSVWGSYFHVDGEDTLWEKIARKHSKICVPSIDVLAKNPIDYNYNCFDSKNPSSCGYYPHDPFDPYVEEKQK